MKRALELFWHRTLGRPYRLQRTVDQGRGAPVVLLHGVGSFGGVWKGVAERLSGKYRVVAFDLLGFGVSPKPDWPEYSVDDHARAAIAAIQRLRLRQPVVLVGHSMGCLVALRVARLRPRLVRHLILYEMPMYEGLPASRRYQVRRDLYYKLYQYIIHSPNLAPSDERSLRRAVARMAGLDVSKEMWRPFIKSLEHTIMRQAPLEDIAQLHTPIDIIYGSLDMLVIRGKPQKVFGENAQRIQTHTIAEGHTISRRASRFIAQRVEAAVKREA